MEALRKSGKSLKDLTEAQLDAIHENLDDGESHLWEAHEEFSKKITQLVCYHAQSCP